MSGATQPGAALAAVAQVVIGPGAEMLEAIRTPTVAMALWTRTNPCPGAAAPAEPLLLGPVPVDCGVELEAALRAAGYGESCAALVADISELAERFAELAGVRQLRIRLDRVTTDSCRLFHADYVTMRLLCSYAGPGTEWREAPEGPVGRMAPGDVAILKGRLLIDPPTVLHRSPPIADTGAERVLLAIDALA